MRWCRRQVWRPKRDDGRAILTVRLTLRDEIQVVNSIRGGVRPVSVFDPARCQRCPQRVEDGTVLVFWIWVAGRWVRCRGCRLGPLRSQEGHQRVSIISSLAPSEWQQPTVRPVISWSRFRPSWTNWAASLFRDSALPRVNLLALSTSAPKSNAPSALSGRIGPAVSLYTTANGGGRVAPAEPGIEHESACPCDTDDR
jgi:hypothetical protein